MALKSIGMDFVSEYSGIDIFYHFIIFVFGKLYFLFVDMFGIRNPCH